MASLKLESIQTAFACEQYPDKNYGAETKYDVSGIDDIMFFSFEKFPQSNLKKKIKEVNLYVYLLCNTTFQVMSLFALSETFDENSLTYQNKEHLDSNNKIAKQNYFETEGQTKWVKNDFFGWLNSKERLDKVINKGLALRVDGWGSGSILTLYSRKSSYIPY